MTHLTKQVAVGLALAAAVIAGASALRYRSHEGAKPPQTGALAQAGSYARSEAHGTLHMPSSADKVSVAVSTSPGSANDKRSMAITLHIQKGWHVNANPASLPFLIPTTVRAKLSGKAVPLAIRYPPGRESDIRLGGKPIRVYNNNTVLVAQFEDRKSPIPQSTQDLDIFVAVQSCSNQGICLPPSTLKEEIHVKG